MSPKPEVENPLAPIFGTRERAARVQAPVVAAAVHISIAEHHQATYLRQNLRRTLVGKAVVQLCRSPSGHAYRHSTQKATAWITVAIDLPKFEAVGTPSVLRLRNHGTRGSQEHSRCDCHSASLRLRWHFPHRGRHRTRRSGKSSLAQARLWTHTATVTAAINV